MAPNLTVPSMYVLYADPYCVRQQTNTIFNGRPVKHKVCLKRDTVFKLKQIII